MVKVGTDWSIINRFPDNFGDLAGKTFEQAFSDHPVFVDFTLNDMKNTTGLWLSWQRFCKERNKLDAEECPRTID